MKNMGISRKVDELGRVVLPAEVRRALDLNQADSISIFLDINEQTVMLKKCKPSCFCCQSTEHLKTLSQGKYICATCFQQVV
jgi:transcriptional pleiotropic regulator of transition state genes